MLRSYFSAYFWLTSIQADDQVKKANIEIEVTKLDKDPIEVV